MRRRGRIWTAVSAGAVMCGLLVVLSAGLLAAQAATPRHGDRKLLPKANRVIAAGSTRATSGGVVAHPRQGRLTAYVTFTGYKRLERTLARYPAVNEIVTVVKVKHSLRSLIRLTNHVNTRKASKAGVKLNEWGPDVQTNKVQFGVESSVPQARRYFDRLYGRGLVQVDKDTTIATAD